MRTDKSMYETSSGKSHVNTGSAYGLGTEIAKKVGTYKKKFSLDVPYPWKKGPLPPPTTHSLTFSTSLATRATCRIHELQASATTCHNRVLQKNRILLPFIHYRSGVYCHRSALISNQKNRTVEHVYIALRSSLIK